MTGYRELSVLVVKVGKFSGSARFACMRDSLVNHVIYITFY
jgi:hypothetical protein